MVLGCHCYVMDNNKKVLGEQHMYTSTVCDHLALPSPPPSPLSLPSLPSPPSPSPLPSPPLPSLQIRNAFARLLLYVCQESNKDPRYTLEPSFLTEKEATCTSFTEVILYRLLELLKREVPQHGRHLQQYFSFFMAFAYRTKLEVGRGDRLHLSVGS